MINFLNNLFTVARVLGIAVPVIHIIYRKELSDKINYLFINSIVVLIVINVIYLLLKLCGVQGLL